MLPADRTIGTKACGIAAILIAAGSFQNLQAQTGAQPAHCELETIERQARSGTMPDLVQCPFDTVSVALRRIDHPPRQTLGRSQLPKGVVYAQSPPAQTAITSGTAIELSVSNGLPPLATEFLTDLAKNLAVANQSADVIVRPGDNAPTSTQPGRSLKFFVVVGNLGPHPATGIRVVSDVLNLEITKVYGACAALPCMIESLNAGSNASIWVLATAQGPGPFRLSVNATGRQTDPTPSNNRNDFDGQVVAAEAPPSQLTPTPPNATPPTLPHGPEGKASTATANISLAAFGEAQLNGQPGERIRYSFVIRNEGPATATNVVIHFAPRNLSKLKISGACSSTRCRIDRMAVRARNNVQIVATINRVGPFGVDVSAGASESDPDSIDNTVRFSGDARVSIPPPTPPHIPPHPLWKWITGGLVLLVATGAGVRIHRRRRWRLRTKVSCKIEQGHALQTYPVNLAMPPVRMHVLLEIGAVKSIAVIPILKVEKPHGR